MALVWSRLGGPLRPSPFQWLADFLHNWVATASFKHVCHMFQSMLPSSTSSLVVSSVCPLSVIQVVGVRGCH
eukprot:11768204-Prorocentrum_lima.AAC.1